MNKADTTETTGAANAPGRAAPLLHRDARGLSLGLVGMAAEHMVRPDFFRLLPRVRGGRARGELLVRAAKPRGARPLAVDATAGLGEDAFLLAAAGFQVEMYENNPLIAALLADALARARLQPELSAICGRMVLHEADSVAALPGLAFRPDVVLLDPMFPVRGKSALVKKKLQLLQMVERPCADEAALLQAALAARPRRVVIKRPLKGPWLAGVKPDWSLRGRAIRFDCLLPRPPRPPLSGASGCVDSADACG